MLKEKCLDHYVYLFILWQSLSLAEERASSPATAKAIASNPAPHALPQTILPYGLNQVEVDTMMVDSSSAEAPQQ